MSQFVSAIYKTASAAQRAAQLRAQNSGAVWFVVAESDYGAGPGDPVNYYIIDDLAGVNFNQYPHDHILYSTTDGWY